MSKVAIRSELGRHILRQRELAPIAKVDPYARAVRMTEAVCAMAGSMSLISDIKGELARAGVVEAIATGQTAPIFDWLLTTFSYQGVSDQAARTYMDEHGEATWQEIDASLNRGCPCAKLRSYWHYDGCGYSKSQMTCAMPGRIKQCALPRFDLRNGRLNQLAYSFFLFVRDIAQCDLVGWIDAQLRAARATRELNLATARQDALIGPIANVYGMSDKVLNMTLSNLLIGAGSGRPIWFNTGISMIAVDSLVHNFLHRTGIQRDCGHPHSYGPACYDKDGCADVIRSLSGHIDARAFNLSYPQRFPRFVQHAIWRYCAADGLNICNGVKIDDRYGCLDTFCRLGYKCERIRLKI